jgi:hypothetical protein
VLLEDLVARPRPARLAAAVRGVDPA